MNKFTETIDNYLSGRMSADEKKNFEAQLKLNPELKAEYDLQVQSLKGIQRYGVKKAVKTGFTKASAKLKITKATTIVLITALATTLIFVAKNKFFSKEKQNIRYELNEENKKQWSDADKYLAPQIFEINAKSDTVIETTNGVVVAIPAGAFYNKHGEEVKDNIEIEIKEALNSADIMQAGLSTTSDGKLLETGGMFYINARQNGENLSVVQNKGLYVNVPTNKLKKEMMLFEGQRLDNGQINWTKPKPFENKLNTVDILSLNFYPPHFLDTLKSFGYDIKNKKLTDSIYYSLVCPQASPQPQQAPAMARYETDSFDGFASHHISDTAKADSLESNPETIFRRNCAVCHSLSNQKITGPGLAGIADRAPKGNWLFNYIKNNEKVIKSGDAYANKVLRENGNASMTVFEGVLSDAEIKALVDYLKYGSVENTGEETCEINPSRIQAIWDKKFNNTLLATKEFEERLQVIFKTCNASLLSLYIQNMNKNMYEIDSMAMNMLVGEEAQYHDRFVEFYNRRNGGVSINEKHLQKLQAYFEEKRNLYKEAATAALTKMYADENKKDNAAMENRNTHEQQNRQRKEEVFQQEYTTNLKEAYRQLGKPMPVRLPSNYYGVTIQTLGWKNVDAYVLESTTNRTTLNYTDSSTGKKAIIKYEPLSITINNFADYDRVYAYLLPDKLSSFQLMQNNGNVYKENLNELFNYSVVVMGFKNNTVYYKQFATVKPESISISLEETTKDKLKNLLEKYDYKDSHTEADMIGELNYNLFEQQETARHKSIFKREEIREKLLELIYPCYVKIIYADKKK